MAIYKTNLNVFKDNDFLTSYPQPMRADSDDLTLSDVDVWQVLHECETAGVYACFEPFADFYMITNNNRQSFFKGNDPTDMDKFLESIKCTYRMNGTFQEEVEELSNGN